MRKLPADFLSKRLEAQKLVVLFGGVNNSTFIPRLKSKYKLEKMYVDLTITMLGEPRPHFWLVMDKETDEIRQVVFPFWHLSFLAPRHRPHIKQVTLADFFFNALGEIANVAVDNRWSLRPSPVPPPAARGATLSSSTRKGNHGCLNRLYCKSFERDSARSIPARVEMFSIRRLGSRKRFLGIGWSQTMRFHPPPSTLVDTFPYAQFPPTTVDQAEGLLRCPTEVRNIIWDHGWHAFPTVPLDYSASGQLILLDSPLRATWVTQWQSCIGLRKRTVGISSSSPVSGKERSWLLTLAIADLVTSRRGFSMLLTATSMYIPNKLTAAG